MNTKKSPEKPSEEYHYPEEQFGEEVTPPEPPEKETKPKFRKISRKKIFFVVIVIIIIGVIYQFLGQREKTVLESAKRELAQVEAPVSPKQPAKSASVAKTEKTEVTRPAALSAEQTRQLAQIAKQEATIKELQGAVKQANQSINDLNTALLSLANSVEALANQVVELRNVERVQGVAATNAPPPMFHLKAVISGRAWIESGKGRLITVKVGDNLPGYGEVTGINPGDGLVNTSSGAVITYGLHDS